MPIPDGINPNRTLLESAKIIRTWRGVRPLQGSSGLLVRTFGCDFPSLSFLTTYEHPTSGTIQTEFGEFVDALTSHDVRNDEDSKVDLALEVADILYQRGVLELNHWENPLFSYCDKRFTDLMSMCENALRLRGISPRVVTPIAQVKYGIRSTHLTDSRVPAKDRDFEHYYALQKYRELVNLY